MSTDRELLELAAKAAGIILEKWHKNFIDMDDNEHGPKWQTDSGLWNPLTDDGDALCLAVKLCILEFVGAETRMSYNQVGDEYENARHAIVWLAAEIGRNML